MPELPEVETTRRGLAPHLDGRLLTAALVREPRLRWPVPDALPQLMVGGRLERVERRAKYLLFRFDRGCLIAHLGMSGSLRLVPEHTPWRTHDHVEFAFEGAPRLRYNDPRRFGSLHWVTDAPEDHFLLSGLGPEPLGAGFDGALLHRLARGRRVAVKAFVMDARIVVGVGNIYATEALFMAGIRPTRAAGQVGRARYDRLAEAIRTVLGRAVTMGGTTLRDFVGGDGKPGYFRQSLACYGRGGEPCVQCGQPLRSERLAQRATVFCPRCQR
ncbi:MAG: bifunctional DNA-formamidopyrimidine glycosylase/DNA-(apurinic or apyrimidinic site) lyase [Pseudomonadales bacterium]|nr:bifunctional DNA-formamidopyrimidine glycosylase/DNA-(apurinic or apyrimidinic site) lyase [Pseudomonadales bacterium]